MLVKGARGNKPLLEPMSIHNPDQCHHMGPQLEQLECLPSEDTPPPPHDYPYYWVILDPKSKQDKVKVTNLKNLPKVQIFEFWNKLYMWHIFWSGLIKCVNMKWIRQVSLKIQSGHDSAHRQTDGRMDGRTDGEGETSIPPSTSLSGGYNELIKLHCVWAVT